MMPQFSFNVFQRSLTIFTVKEYYTLVLGPWTRAEFRHLKNKRMKQMVPKVHSCSEILKSLGLSGGGQITYI